jgi:hypothetical protein
LAKFIDEEYGEFWFEPRYVIQEQARHPDLKPHRLKQRQIQRLRDKIPEFMQLVESTYVGMKTKALFIDDKYGECWVTPHSVLYRQRGHPKRSNLTRKTNMRATCERRYGTPFPAQNKKIARKIAKSANNSHEHKHWKTNEILVAVGSFEHKTLEWLNKNKIDFDWQIKFDMPDGRVYFCDLYLKNDDKYIEIKGYFRKDAKEKWNWFVSTRNNAELWTRQALKKMGIL